MFERLLSCLLLSAVLGAQTPPCAGSNHTNTNITGGVTPLTGGPLKRAFLVTPPAGIAVHGAELFTGTAQGAPGAMRLELWTVHPFTFDPWGPLSGGSLQVSGSGAGWQGTNFEYVRITAGESFWLVWTEPGGSYLPYEPGGVTVSYSEYVGTTWATGGLVPVKWRLRCSWLDGTNVTVTGSPCFASSRPWGTLFTNDDPRVGNADLLLQGTGFVPGQIGFLALGLQQFPGVPLPWTLPAGCIVQSSMETVLIGFTTSGGVLDGHVAFHLPVPPDPLMVGLSAFCQLGVLDPQGTAPLPLQLSNGLQLVVH